MASIWILQIPDLDPGSAPFHQVPWGCFSAYEALGVLLEVHRHVSAARHPRHRVQRIGALKAAVGTLTGGMSGGSGSGGGKGDAVLEPAVLRCVVGDEQGV